MRYIRCRVSSLILLLSFIAHFTHGAPVSSLASSELENDFDSPYMDVYDSAYPFPDFDTSHDHNLEPPDPISDSVCSSQSSCGLSSSDVAVRSPAEVTIHRRRMATQNNGNAEALKKDTRCDKGGGKTRKIGNAIPGPIGAALKVIGTFLSILGKIFGGLGAKAKESAHQRASFTQRVVNKTAKKHPGWMIVAVYEKLHVQTYFPGKKDHNWSVKEVKTHTGLGDFPYILYAVEAGLLYLDGDRGYENWAWQVPVQRFHAIPKDATDVERRILVVDGTYPPNVPPVPGRCFLHIDVFEMGKKPRKIVAGLLDNARNTIGYGSGSLPFTLSNSRLKAVIKVAEPEKGKKEVFLQIKFASIHSGSQMG
ncbi:hypothetical protein BDP27DRAFT_1403092 [Rhodocollybia butyracea]|uniref:Uncharacterized protein n=1 Tax=Rhodocollybia butyracea TaxID=206335 RepID=A0A9P5PMP6_9AGAR|nr:hypothetical protein BDP27DRAFT_1403092 [Rhodocollybia butyracea]